MHRQIIEKLQHSKRVLLRVVFVLFAMLLVSCGESCYDETNIGDDGVGYVMKTYEYSISAKQDYWEDTGIYLVDGTTFTIDNIDGYATCAQPPEETCDMSYTTMCQGDGKAGKKYLCLDKACTNKNLIDYCSGNKNCEQINSCSGSSETFICRSGIKYKWDETSNRWENYGENCSDAIFCDKSDLKMRVGYSITDSDNKTTVDSVDLKVGKCTDQQKQCTEGYPHKIPANKSSWTTIYDDIYPGDEIELKIPAPQLGSTVLIPSDASLGPTVNAWSANKSPVLEEKCPASIPMKFTPSNYTKCPNLVDGYFTCPMCEGVDRHRNVSDDSQKKCDGSGKDLYCWKTGGSGMWMKMVGSSEDCDSTPDCSESDGNCIWFDQYTSGDDLKKFGILSYDVLDKSGEGCSGTDADLSKCTNRITKRNIVVSNSNKKQKLCMKMADGGSYTDNTGGYTVNTKRKMCVAHDGKPSDAARFFSDHVLALEYIVSNDTPSNSDTGIPMESSVSYPFSVKSNATGNLYIRVRAAVHSDNSGFYNVLIKYKQYSTISKISTFIEGVREQVRNMTLSASRQYFHNMSCVGDSCNCVSGNCTNQYLDYIRVLLILYIAGYGLAFLIGAVQISQMDLLIRAIKIGVVLTLISDTSFDFFYNNFFGLFLDGMDELIIKSQIGFTGGGAGNTFDFIDGIMNIMLSKTTWLKLGSLLFISPMGMILAILLIVGVILFMVGIFKAVVAYLMAVLVIGILMLLAPIFIPFMLFRATNHLFENWVKMFVKYSLEPVMLLIGLGVLVQLGYLLLSSIINFHVCWKCMWPINFAFWPSVTNALSLTDTLFCLQFFGPFGVMPDGGGAALKGIGIGVVDILLFVIIGHLIMGYDKLVSKIIDRISEGTGAQFSHGQSYYSSAGDAILARTRITHLSRMGYAAASAGAGKVARSAMKSIGLGKGAQEDRLIKEAQKTDYAESARIAANSRELSDKLSAGVSNEQKEELKKLENPNLDDQEKLEIANKVGRNMFNKVGNDEQFRDFVDNMHKLSDVESGSQIHSKLSPSAQKLYELMQNEGVAQSIRDIKSATASTDMKEDAMGRLSEAMFKNSKDVHKVFYGSELSESKNKLIEEISQLKRESPSAFRKAVPKE